MLNIISRSIVAGGVNGPQKVVANLIKGLDILGYPYCINKALDATSQLWIHDDTVALKEASRLGLNAIVGPNLYILPKHVPANINLNNFLYIHPSKWAVDFWKDLGFNRCPLDFWATGIDTNQFKERSKPENGIVLIYFKQRYQEELLVIKETLIKQNINYEVIIYGSYKQSDYSDKLKKTKYIIWLGRQESQGIALEEALAMDVPILVWDVSNIGHWLPTNREKNIFSEKELQYKNTTSAYYFDDTCGIKFKDRRDLATAIEKMNNNWKSFEPRKYIPKNLSLEKQAKSFIELFDKYYHIPYSDGKVETQKTDRKWRNSKMYYKMFIFIKEKIKKCVKLLKKQ